MMEVLSENEIESEINDRDINIITPFNTNTISENQISPTREIACQTEPNLIDKLIDSSNSRKQRLEDVDLYQEYVRSAQCTQFWPLDKNPIRQLVPSMIKVDLPEQHLKNESLMFDLVQAISNNSKLVNLLAKYIHHIVPNVIISKRIDLIPLITCTIRVCREQSEQERLVGLLFNLIKRPNEEQRRMILSGIVVVLQVSPSQNCQMLLPNLWDHVNDKFPERRILLAESCASLANYVRPALRTNLILSILIQLLKDKNAAVKSAACKSFACLLTLIMDTNDEVFDACLSAAEDLIQDVLQQTPMSFCEHRFELEEMRYCALETIYPLICMWAVKLNRFKYELADFYLAKAEKYLANLLTGTTNQSSLPSPIEFSFKFNSLTEPKVLAAAEVARRRSIFLETRNKRQSSSTDSGLSAGTPPSPAHSNSRPSLASNLFAAARRQSAFVTESVVNSTGLGKHNQAIIAPAMDNQAIITAQKAVCAYLRMLTYLMPFVFSDSVHSCAWLSKSSSTPTTTATNTTSTTNITSTSSSSASSISSSSGSADINSSRNETAQAARRNSDQPAMARAVSPPIAPINGVKPLPRIEGQYQQQQNQQHLLHHSRTSNNGSNGSNFVLLFGQPLKLNNKLLDPSLILEDSAIIAFHDQIESMHLVESLDWLLDKFLPNFLKIIATLSQARLQVMLGLTTTSSSTNVGLSGNSSNSLPSSSISSHCNTKPNNNASSSSPASPFNHSTLLTELLTHCLSSIRNLCLLFGRPITKSKIRPIIRNTIIAYKRHDHNHNQNSSSNNNYLNFSQSSGSCYAPITLYAIQLAALTAFEPIEQAEFEQLVSTIGEALVLEGLTRIDVEILAISIRIIATSPDQIQSPSTRQKFLTYTLDALVRHSIKFINCPSTCNNTGGNNNYHDNSNAGSSLRDKFVGVLMNNSNNINTISDAFKFKSSSSSSSSSCSSTKQTSHRDDNNNENNDNKNNNQNHDNSKNKNNNNISNQSNSNNSNPSKAKPKEFMLIIFRHILTCLIDPSHRPADWAQILVTKFLPTLIALANDSTDVYICTYARLMCAKLVETFDLHFNNPKLTREQALATLPALESLKALTEQIKASNLKRQIEFLLQEYTEKF